MNEPKELTRQTSFDVIRDDGEKLLNNNEFFKDLSEIMENELFRKFFQKYFYNSTESKITLIYMTLYNEFKTKWKELNDAELDKRINVFLLWRIMKDRKTNKFAIETVMNKMENPNNTDILLVHGPPFEYGDLLVPRSRADGEYPKVGCFDLSISIERVKPKIVGFGHIHEGYSKIKGKDNIIYINSSSLNENHSPTNPPKFHRI